MSEEKSGEGNQKETAPAKKARRIRERFRSKIETFAETGSVGSSEWLNTLNELKGTIYDDGDWLIQQFHRVSEFLSMSGFPILPLKFTGSEDSPETGEPANNKVPGAPGKRSRRKDLRIKLRLRPFAVHLENSREVRKPLAERCLSFESLKPRLNECVYVGTGTTMRFLTEQLIDEIEQRKFEIVTDNLEALALCYFQAGPTLMKDGALRFMGCAVDWNEGLVNPKRKTKTIQTAYLSTSSLTDSGEFRTRDQASQCLAKEALQTDGLQRVIILMEGSKIGTAGQGTDGGPIGFKSQLEGTSVQAYLVTDSLNDQQRSIVDQLGLILVDETTTKEVLVEREQESRDRIAAKALSKDQNFDANPDAVIGESGPTVDAESLRAPAMNSRSELKRNLERDSER